MGRWFDSNAAHHSYIQQSMNIISHFQIRPYRLARSRTPPFHGENMGSNPIRDAIQYLPNFARYNRMAFAARRAPFHHLSVSSEVEI